MSFLNYLKRGLRFIIKGIPENKVFATVQVVAPSEILKDRIALITGGTSGIGFEIAKAYINAGATCVITGRNNAKVQEAVKKIDEEAIFKGKIYGIEFDVCDVARFDEKLSSITELIGNFHIDILVNNAGVVGGEIADCTEDSYDLIVDTNLKGLFFLSQKMGHYMKKNSIRGNILNIGSSSSLRPATSAYTMTKWGVLGLTRGLAKIMSPYGITVNGVAPGPTATPMLKKDTNDNIYFPNPLGRYAFPQEIANMAVFLVSEMGRSIIGDMIFMTGGSGVVTYDDVKYSF